MGYSVYELEYRFPVAEITYRGKDIPDFWISAGGRELEKEKNSDCGHFLLDSEPLFCYGTIRREQRYANSKKGMEVLWSRV